MNNRIPASPILFVALLISLTLPAQAEPGVPSANVSGATNESSAAAIPPATTAPAAAPAVAPEPNATSPAAVPAPEGDSATYTVVKGDSYWLIAHKHGCSVKALLKENNLTKKALLHPGQVLKLPPATTTPASSDTATPAPKTEKTAKPAVVPTPTTRPNASTHKKPSSHHKSYAQAQPVQDFDIPASTFASCPVPIPSPDSDTDTTSTTTSAADTEATPSVRAELVSPTEFDDAQSEPKPKPVVKAVATDESEVAANRDTTPSVPETKHMAKSTFSARPANSEPTSITSSSKANNHWFNPFYTAPSEDWGTKFLVQARALGDRDIEYDEEWRPPGEQHAWAMDCSNTSRYLYKVTAGIDLPRTASDQYYYLHLQNKAWDVPQAPNGFADCNYLRENLKPGDLLFWENTYRPERQPPITHVMVFLGTNEKGQWIMAGSQTSRGGEHNRSNGGPDIYVFDPTKPCGGYSTWMGLVHHQGRFCAYGRPLEADPSKLAVAENN